MELIIVMLHLDYQIMPIVALQHHVMQSMGMDDAVRLSLSVEKVGLGRVYFFTRFGFRALISGPVRFG